MKKVYLFICIFIILFSMVFGQQQYGNLRGTVTDTEGEPLPGVNITLASEEFGNRSIITTQQGIFRFLNITPGFYTLKCELHGFNSYIQENLDIRIGTNFDLEISLLTATVEEEVTIVAESPLVDTKKVGTAVNVTLTQLQEVPSARDPWVILQQAPGIHVGQENVGGSLSGQQSAFSSKGTYGLAHMYNMDGIPITDLAASGASTRYYDFDSFGEIQIVTTGADASVQASGVSINFVTRRGGNKFEVMGRLLFTNDKLQGSNLTQELKDLDYKGNRIEQISDYGLQVGGPIIRDRLWFWLGYGVQDLHRLTIDDFPEHNRLDGINAKLNFRPSRYNRAELAFLYNNKRSFNRNVGPRRPIEASWDQTGNGAPFIKLEDEHTFSDNFLLSFKIGGKLFGDWFAFEPVGGTETQSGYDLGTGIYSDTTYYNRSERPNWNSRLDGNYFVEDLFGGNHEFKFGAEYNYFPTRDTLQYPQDVFKYYSNGTPIYAEVMRERQLNFLGKRIGIYVNDAFTIKRLTLNVGLRYDWQNSIIEETSVPASRIAPDLLPALTVPKVDPKIPVTGLSPRLGLTYALTADRKTILRTNLAVYTLQAPAGYASHINPTNLSSAGFVWRDLNGDDLVTLNELPGYPRQILWYGGFDPAHPTSIESPNRLSDDLYIFRTKEFLLGVEREVIPDFSLAVNLTLRRTGGWNWDVMFDAETGWKESQSDWLGPIQKSLVYNGVTYGYEYWTLNRPKTPGTIKEGRPDYHNKYISLEFIATKRLSHRWMMNYSFTWQRHREYYGEKGFLDPTNIKYWDGQPHIWSPRWMSKLSFLYQLPWGFHFSCFANAREGTVFWKYLRVPSPERAAVGLGSWVNLDIENYGASRLENFYNLDVSLVKDFLLGRNGQLSLQVDVFNVFNFNWELTRYGQVNSPRFNEIEQILNPRVIRFGVRYRY